MVNITMEDKKSILRYLYKMAVADFILLENEKRIIERAADFLKIDIYRPKPIKLDNWNKDDEIRLKNLISNQSECLGLVVQWATEVMNSDNLKHQNELHLIMDLIKSSLDNPEYPKAKIILTNDLDDTLKEMVKKTPKLCMEKADHWQKSKPGKPIKRVAASISYEIAGKKHFVTAVNYELSTPGGSRCAEQNAIGMAIALNPHLKKEQIKDVFIFGGGGFENPCWPCGICTENLNKINSNNQINLYVYPENYKYSENSTSETMLRVKLSHFSHK